MTCKPDKFGGNKTLPEATGDMGKEDRKRVVLRILAESEFALPPAVIFRNAKLQGATFERRSVDNYLEELHAEGKVMKVDPGALESGEIEEIELGKEGYFIATVKGREVFD